MLDDAAVADAAGADDGERLGNNGFFAAPSSSLVVFLGPREGAVKDGGGGTSVFFNTSFGFDGTAAAGADKTEKSGALAGAAAAGGGGAAGSRRGARARARSARGAVRRFGTQHARQVLAVDAQEPERVEPRGEPARPGDGTC